MSGSLTPTVAAAPTYVETASNLLSLMAALNGTATDYNPGSQIRTLAESLGAVVEQQGVGAQALAMQALVYSAMSLFGITQAQPTAATGVVTFATSLPLSGAPNTTQAIPIVSGTLVQSTGGVQFATTSTVILASGTSTVLAGIVATVPGTIGNATAGAINGQPLTSVGYPVYATNTTPTAGGTDAGSQSSALALFTARIASLGLSSPVAVANAAIGQSVSGETVKYAAAFEPWIAAGSGAGSGTAGFTLFIDNGTGGASAALLTQVRQWITGNVTTGQSGFRPAGVPFIVSGAVPVFATVAVSGTIYPGLFATGAVVTSLVSNIQSYFTSLGFAPAAAYQPQVAAAVGDAGAGAFSSLTVNLFYSGSMTPVPVVSGAVGTRVILGGISAVIDVGP